MVDQLLQNVPSSPNKVSSSISNIILSNQPPAIYDKETRPQHQPQACANTSQTGFKQFSSSSFKQVQPLNQRAASVSNVKIIQPVALKRLATPSSLTCNLSSQSLCTTSSAADIQFVAYDYEKENMISIESPLNIKQSKIQTSHIFRPKLLPSLPLFDQRYFSEQLLQQLQLTIEQGLEDSNAISPATININVKRRRCASTQQNKDTNCSSPCLSKKRSSTDNTLPINCKQLFQEDSGEENPSIKAETGQIPSLSALEKTNSSGSNSPSSDEEEVNEEQLLLLKRRTSSTCNVQDTLKKSRVCNCKKTKCLKLYCDCFAAGEYCGDGCNCSECSNTISNKEARDKIAELTLLSTKGQRKLTAKKGCNCRRSGCQKKYCQCYQDGLKCGDHCKCTGCENCLKPADVNANNNTWGVSIPSTFAAPNSQVLTGTTLSNFDSILQSQSRTAFESKEEDKSANLLSECTTSTILQDHLFQQIFAGGLSPSEETNLMNNPLFQLASLHATLQQVSAMTQITQPHLYKQEQRQESESEFSLERLFLQAAAAHAVSVSSQGSTHY